MAVEKFHELDEEYRAWLRDHPDSYVLNCMSLGNLSDARLHRGDCRDLLLQFERGVLLTHEWRKVCSDSLAEL